MFRHIQTWIQSQNKRHLLFMCMVILSLVVVSVLSWVFASKQSLYQPREETILLPAVQVKSTAASPSIWQDEMIQVGEQLPDVLKRLGIEQKEIDAIVHDSVVRSHTNQLPANHLLSAYINEQNQLTKLQFFNIDDVGEKTWVSLSLQNGQWRVENAPVVFETLPVLKSIVVNTSARGSLAQSGVPVEIREALSELFRERLDLQKLDTQSVIRIVYEVQYYQGEEIATGNILCVEISDHQGTLYQAYYFDPSQEGNGQFYDAAGVPLRTGFSIAPVTHARISSAFGWRHHPILKTWRMHAGIDYAAPQGTPIYAPADGVVKSMGSLGGYGNTVIITHSDVMETLYAHMSRFAPITPGIRVRTGDVIGYVGSTGRSTGPHLHYEVRLNGEAVNPSSVALPNKPISPEEWDQFYATQQHWDGILKNIRPLQVNIGQMN